MENQNQENRKPWTRRYKEEKREHRVKEYTKDLREKIISRLKTKIKTQPLIPTKKDFCAMAVRYYRLGSIGDTFKN